MKLYYSPGACSLATRISLHEAGIEADYERVDLRTKITEQGHDYASLNPKGAVPMLVLDDGEKVTENVAVLSLIAERRPELAPGGPLGHIRLLEYLSYLSSELHVAFRPLWTATSEMEKASAIEAIARRLAPIERCMHEMYLFGPRFTVADAYLFVMLRWVRNFSLAMPTELSGYVRRVAERPAVRRALAEEGLDLPAAEGAVVRPVQLVAS